MKTVQVKKLSSFERLVYWIMEREVIRRKRCLGLERPWTDDEILRKYRFCNVRRMDDRTSDWLLRNWYRPNRDHENSLIACVLARQLNNSESLEELGFPKNWDPNLVQRVLDGRAQKGLKNFSAAYMITGTLGGTKVEQIVWKVVDPIFRSPPELDYSSMQRSVEALVGRTGISWFIAGQVVADLRWALSGSWKDRYVWAPMGPGSKRGLNRLNGREKDSPLGRTEFQKELSSLIERLSALLPTDLTKRLEAIDYQNCLCEYDKYERALFGEGRPKQLFNGEAQ